MSFYEMDGWFHPACTSFLVKFRTFSLNMYVMLNFMGEYFNKKPADVNKIWIQERIWEGKWRIFYKTC